MNFASTPHEFDRLDENKAPVYLPALTRLEFKNFAEKRTEHFRYLIRSTRINIEEHIAFLLQASSLEEIQEYIKALETKVVDATKQLSRNKVVVSEMIAFYPAFLITLILHGAGDFLPNSTPITTFLGIQQIIAILSLHDQTFVDGRTLESSWKKKRLTLHNTELALEGLIFMQEIFRQAQKHYAAPFKKELPSLKEIISQKTLELTDYTTLGNHLEGYEVIVSEASHTLSTLQTKYLETADTLQQIETMFSEHIEGLEQQKEQLIETYQANNLVSMQKHLLKQGLPHGAEQQDLLIDNTATLSTFIEGVSTDMRHRMEVLSLMPPDSLPSSAQ